MVPPVLLPYMAPAAGRTSYVASVGWGVPQVDGQAARTAPLQASASAGLQSLDSHGSSIAGQPLTAAQQVRWQAWVLQTGAMGFQYVRGPQLVIYCRLPPWPSACATQDFRLNLGVATQVPVPRHSDAPLPPLHRTTSRTSSSMWPDGAAAGSAADTPNPGQQVWRSAALAEEAVCAVRPAGLFSLVV